MMTPIDSDARRRQYLIRAIAILVLSAGAVAAAIVATRRGGDPVVARDTYEVNYTVGFDPATGLADVAIEAVPGYGALREARFRMPEDRYTGIEGDGSIRREGDVVVWVPERDRPQVLRYRYRIASQRTGGGYDAAMGADWAIVRGDDLVPPATVRTTRGADANARLRFTLPPGWTGVDTPYRRSRDGEAFVVVNPDRSFDRPRGWIIAGKVASRREYLRGTQVSVAAPLGSGAGRLDLLAFLNLLVPEARRAFGDLPPKLLVVTAGDPMWRGGLSGPRSLFVHADRPLVSENGTSTLAHELVHVVTGVRGADGDDWIAEGLAEFYSIELMRRSGLLSDDRAEDAFAWMARKGAGVASLTAARSSGDRTARAVQLFHALDAEIRGKKGRDTDLDDLVRTLMDDGETSAADLRAAAETLLGSPSKVLADAGR